MVTKIPNFDIRFFDRKKWLGPDQYFEMLAEHVVKIGLLTTREVDMFTGVFKQKGLSPSRSVQSLETVVKSKYEQMLEKARGQTPDDGFIEGLINHKPKKK